MANDIKNLSQEKYQQLFHENPLFLLSLPHKTPELVENYDEENDFILTQEYFPNQRLKLKETYNE